MLHSLICKNLHMNMQSYFLNQRFFSCSSVLAPISLPSKSEVHIWHIIPDEVRRSDLLNQYMDLLSPHEKESVLRMNGDRLQKNALLSRVLVRTTLSRYTNLEISPSSLKFRKNKFGKPEIEWQENEMQMQPQLHFNITHSSSLIACGVTVDMQIGLDVEEKVRRPKTNVLSFARRYFTPHEVDLLLSLSDHEIQRQEFLKIWTLKEAYVKALGRGFSAAPFREFIIQFESSENMNGFREFDWEASKISVKPCSNPDILTTNWRFGLLELANTHYLATCKENDDIQDGSSLRLKVWKTIPLVEDECVSGTDAVIVINGFS